MRKARQSVMKILESRPLFPKCLEYRRVPEDEEEMKAAEEMEIDQILLEITRACIVLQKARELQPVVRISDHTGLWFSEGESSLSHVHLTHSGYALKNNFHKALCIPWRLSITLSYYLVEYA